MIEINRQEIEYVFNSHADAVGRVFSWQGHLLRAIRNQYVAEVEELLSSGLLQELNDAGLFTEVRKTDYQLSGYGLVLEHQRVPTVTYPYEWSFTMLRDAAIVMLRVNLIARKYGYQTKDGHGYNVLFYGSQPVFIDLGSLIKLQAGDNAWRGYEEFLRFFFYPLQLWCEGNEFLARRVLSGAMKPLMPHDSYLAYRVPLTRHLNGTIRQRISRVPLLLRRVSSLPKDEIRRIWLGKKGVLLRCLRPVLAMGGATLNLSPLLKKVQRMELNEGKSRWGSYHLASGLIDEAGELRPSPRFKRIAELIDKYNVKEVMELAGNQGAFSRYLLSETGVKSVICSDYDTIAIDRLYRALGSDQQKLTPAVLDFMSPTLLAETESAPSRMKAEAVLALAVTHHLLLRDFLPIDRILAAIGQYAESYVFVEYMPLGLYDGRSASALPDWYGIEWFRAACMRHFVILHEEQLEENRILFIGRLNQRMDALIKKDP